MTKEEWPREPKATSAGKTQVHLKELDKANSHSHSEKIVSYH